jgi:ubiquinone/menaquinone biosynthesis C-methylase UbiE
MDNFIRRVISPPEKTVSRLLHIGSVAADLGCGPGYFTIPIAKLVGPTGKVYAVDSDEKSIRVIETKSGAQGLGSIIEAHTASAADVHFIPTGRVDFVLAHGLLCCMTKHDQAVAEIKRVLKPTGIAYLSVAKLYRRNDPRAVPKEEWDRILTGFAVEDKGEGVLNRWAIVSRGSLTKESPKNN